ncbi:MAG: 3-isopropylmalate dehydrogenase [Alphaproteobacteria bacterium]|nr:3-isopropylmalate dehydrogenase [Alphaproteobacteria bacterium]
MSYRITLLPGDGVGPEVTAAARAALDAASTAFNLGLSFDERAFGGAGIDAFGAPYPDETRTAVAAADAIFLGAVGGPKWEKGGPRPEQGLLDLRRDLGVYANLRPTIVAPGFEDRSPLKADVARGVDFLIVRELNGGVYYGDREEGKTRASDLCVYTRDEVRRVARVAFEAARGRRGKVTSVDKANVLATSRLWRAAVEELRAEAYADVELEHALVDAMAMHLVTRPASFDVILTENMFGDILSDEASVLSGSIGMAPSASLGDGKGLYEPIHGSAPDIAGKGVANPIGAIMSAAMLARHSLGRDDAAAAIERAVAGALDDGLATRDLGGDATTTVFSNAVAERLA